MVSEGVQWTVSVMFAYDHFDLSQGFVLVKHTHLLPLWVKREKKNFFSNWE